MVRCGQNRSEMKYESECVNARDAINRIERSEERARRAELEAQSERKRQALRRTQEAAAAARRRAVEIQRQRDEAEYLGVFEDGTPNPSVDQQASMAPTSGNAPVATVEAEPAPEPEILNSEPEVLSPEPEELPPETTDLGQVREELRKRQQTAEPNQ